MDNGYIHRIGWWENLQESPINLMVKTMVSCRFSPTNQSNDYGTKNGSEAQALQNVSRMKSRPLSDKALAPLQETDLLQSSNPKEMAPKHMCRKSLYITVPSPSGSSRFGASHVKVWPQTIAASPSWRHGQAAVCFHGLSVCLAIQALLQGAGQLKQDLASVLPHPSPPYNDPANMFENTWKWRASDSEDQKIRGTCLCNPMYYVIYLHSIQTT